MFQFDFKIFFLIYLDKQNFAVFVQVTGLTSYRITSYMEIIKKAYHAILHEKIVK